MESEIARAIPLLQREYVFQGLNSDQTLWVASQFEPVTYEAGVAVIVQGEIADSFYFLLEGSAEVNIKQGGRDRPLNVVHPGDFFGEEGLLFDALRSVTVTTLEKTTFLRMNYDRFNAVLEQYPQIKERLNATAQSRRTARKERFDWLGRDELIYFIVRKHDFFLYLSLVGPILGLVFSAPVFAFAIAGSTSPSMTTTVVTMGITMIVFSFLWGVWNWIDWGNDYYIVTNTRVIWLEKVIGLYDSRREAPLATVLAVNVTSSQLGRILDYGSIEVRTFTGGILMRNASQPKEFAAFVEGYKQRVIQLTKEAEAREMEEELEKALTRHDTLVQRMAPPPAPAAPPKPTPPKDPPTLRERWQTLMKVRFEKDGIITYRKHWFILARRAWMPLLALLIFLVVFLYWFWQRFVYSIIFIPDVFVFIGVFIGLPVLLVWLAYDVVDWANDIYRLSPEQIMDIERKPLGHEDKKTAPLESILSIEHQRSSILGILLNFGDVVINVGQTRFTFDGVFNPDQVHQDISDYREALNRRKRAAEAARERDRMVNWLVAFYNQTEKLEEFENNSDQDGFPG